MANPPDAQRAHGLGVGVEVEARGVDGGEDGHRMVGEPAPGRGESHAAPLRLDQLGAGVPGQCRDLL